MVLVMLACAAPELAPSLDLREDPMLPEVPATSTVLGGGNVAALWNSPTAALLTSEGVLRREGADGLPVEQMEESRLGCGDGGCVIVADGQFETFRPEIFSPMAVREGFGVEATGEQVRLTPAWGKALAIRREGKRVWAGDLEAGAGFDPSQLGEEVPMGDAWLLVRDPLRMRAQAADRLRAEGTEAGEEAARALDAVPDRLLESVKSAAWSLESEEQVLTGRLIAADEEAAQRFEGLARMQLSALSLAPDFRVAAMARNAEVRRVGNVLEIEVRP